MEIIHSIKKYDKIFDDNNSRPIKILGSDLSLYFCKTVHNGHSINKLFYEYLLYHYLINLGYNTPEIKIMKINRNHLEGIFYYNEIKKDTINFLASKQIVHSIDISLLNQKFDISKYDIMNYQDILEIAFFDIFFFNIDRNQGNPNLLYDSNYRFYAIDHGLCLNGSIFEGWSNDNCLSDEESIINHNFIKPILKHFAKKTEFYQCIDEIIEKFRNELPTLKNSFSTIKNNFANHFSFDNELQELEKHLNDNQFSEDWFELSVTIFKDLLRF